MIYAAILLLGFVLGVVTVFVFLNMPNKDERMFNEMVQDRQEQIRAHSAMMRERSRAKGRALGFFQSIGSSNPSSKHH